MALDPHYIPAFTLEEVFFDKDTGAPLSGGLVYFEEDLQRGVLKPIYQITGTSPDYTYTQLDNPMTLSSIGTFVDSLDNPVIPYFYPYDSEGNVDLYYVRVTSAGGVPQFDREAVPYISYGQTPSAVSSVLTNELSNPQFIQVLFNQGGGSYTYSFTSGSNQVINIAPGWDLIVSASGIATVTVTQLTPVGSLNIPTNPGTILTISSAGLITSLQLRQRIYGSPNLWSNGYLSASFVANTQSGISPILKLYYSQSNGLIVDQLLVSATLEASGAYKVYYGTAFIPASNSTQSFPDAYVDIYFVIPLSITIDLSSVMLAFTGATPINNVDYNQESNAIQNNNLFSYYQSGLNFKPISSLLTGWDFALNPAQLNITSFGTTPKYVWDQTICGSAVGTVNVSKLATTGAFYAITTNANEAFYMLQYLTGGEALKTTMSNLSVNINAYSLIDPGVTVNVYLYNVSGGGSIPPLSGSPGTIGTINGAGVFTQNFTTGSNWVLIPNSNQNNLSIPLSFNNTSTDIQLSGWQALGYASSSTQNFAIIVTFTCPVSGTQILVNSISLVPGDIPTRPAPQTQNEVLRECQYYFRTSFLPGAPFAAGAGVNSGESYGLQVLPNAAVNPGPNISFNMRATPNIATYNPVNSNANIYNITTGADWSGTTVGGKTAHGFFTYGTSDASSASGNICGLHWTANAQLGIV